MAMTKCKECGEKISTKADACPKCGAKRKHTSPVGCLIGIILLVIIIGGIIGSLDSTPSSLSSSSSNTTTSKHRPPPTPAEPKLLLLNWTWHQEHDYAIVEGEVQNISSEKLRNVQAVVKFYTTDDKFITSDDAMIEYNPILSGQTSPFKVMARYNPAMESASITFKKLMGGTIPWKKKE